MPTFDLVVRDVRPASELIREILLESATNSPLPSFDAGAHLQVHIPGLNDHRCYSLIVTAPDYNWQSAPSCYRLGVRLEAESRGGSAFMHQLQVGDVIQVKGPVNDFPVHTAAQVEPEYVLIAGGIGITPIASMACTLQQQNRPFRLHYSARSQAQLAFADSLQHALGDKLLCYVNDGQPLDLNALFDTLNPEQHIYVCGPQSMIDAVIEISKARNWPRSHVHFELFTTATAQAGDQPFELELRQSGMTLTVPADKTIVDVLEEAGLDPMFDCKRGECGVCTADVLEGIPDHRDYFLSDNEKASNKVIQTCISRCKTPKLVLDL
ncbi:oxidoreductase [Alcaligenaceae bacterium 429]|nr:oxidoreductase [Alcaligenaceae bacterium 429]